jgi:hypothetical protein
MTPIELHKTLYRTAPLESHLKLYESDKKGFSNKALDEGLFRAIVVLTLHKTMRGSADQPARVALLVAGTHEKWVIDQFDKEAREIFSNFKTMPGTQKSRAALAKLFGNCFKAVFVGSRLLQLPEAPEAWTSFGFSDQDPIPDWMREGLLTV